jgi:hypothetical protein
MRTSTLLSVASLAIAAYAAPLEQDQPSVKAWDSAPQGERIIPPLDKSPPIDGGKRKEILYGPYTVDSSKMLQTRARKAGPCQNCYITAMRATLKYPNGTEALTSQGLWLHHTVLAWQGGTWAAGNERPTIRLNYKSKYGLNLDAANIGVTIDIMSERKEPATVSMAITYEYIEKNSEAGKQYKAAMMQWLAINPFAQPVAGKKMYPSMNSWTATVNGKLLYTIGHMHDGGVNLRLLINGKPVCDSAQFYERNGTIVKAINTAPKIGRRSPQAGHSHAAPTFGGEHIASPGACVDYGSIKKGDVLKAESYYDFTQFKTMSHNGKNEALMGNCRVYIGAQ